LLPVTLAHAAKARSVAPSHRDPFDLLLISQAPIEQLPVATVEPIFRAHGVDVVW
jgi:PIN domain nuclease of toxin-antitoxin system